MDGRVRLRVRRGPLDIQEFVLEGHDTLIFGVAPDCHARMPLVDRTVSRHHFMVEANAPQARLRDLWSLNGTWVNGTKLGGRRRDLTPEEAARQPYQQVDLHDGDGIRVGQTEFEVVIEAPTVCCLCGSPILEAAREAQRFMGDTWLCTRCRAQDALPRTQPAPPSANCRSCGNAVRGCPSSSQALCADCQAKADLEPVVLLARMFATEGKDAALSGEIPGYKVGRRLGMGGMGAVYQARRWSDGASVALKVMLARTAVNELARGRFLRETEVMKRLDHPNVVKLLDSGSAGTGFFFVMEECAGGTVHDLIRRRGGRIPQREAIGIALQALDGLAYAHALKYVHRDIKPQNLLLTSEEGGIAKVSDLGLAKEFDGAGLTGMSLTGQTAGTLAYMPKEQVTNFKYMTPAGDVWSLGATLYQMLSGALPRDVPPGADEVQVVLEEEPVPIERRGVAVSDALARVLETALAVEAEQRYPTAAEFRDALNGV